MRKNILKQKGFSLLEIILSLAILTILATVYTINLLDNEMNIFSNTKRNTAIVLAESSMEAIYNINNIFINFAYLSKNIFFNKVALIKFLIDLNYIHLSRFYYHYQQMSLCNCK